jgi:hypothetical protein
VVNNVDIAKALERPPECELHEGCCQTVNNQYNVSCIRRQFDLIIKCVALARQLTPQPHPVESNKQTFYQQNAQPTSDQQSMVSSTSIHLR